MYNISKVFVVWLNYQRCLKKACVGCMIFKNPLTVVNKDGWPVCGSGPCNANSLTVINHCLIYLIKQGPASQRHLSCGWDVWGLWCHNYFLYFFNALCFCRQRKRHSNLVWGTDYTKSPDTILHEHKDYCVYIFYIHTVHIYIYAIFRIF